MMGGGGKYTSAVTPPSTTAAPPRSTFTPAAGTSRWDSSSLGLDVCAAAMRSLVGGIWCHCHWYGRGCVLYSTVTVGCNTGRVARMGEGWLSDVLGSDQVRGSGGVHLHARKNTVPSEANLSIAGISLFGLLYGATGRSPQPTSSFSDVDSETQPNRRGSMR